MKPISRAQLPSSSSTRPYNDKPETPPSIMYIAKNTHYAGWMLLPLRLFLAITFIYAGIQKLADPQFFHRGTPGYIGNQLIAFAHTTPLHDFLTRVAVPHAMLVGVIVVLGELAIGWGALLGILFRPAAFFGLLLSLLFFLSASWHTYPYFYGADIVFAFCWLTLLLKGPLNTGLPTLDGWLLRQFFSASSSTQAGMPSRIVQILLGRTTFKEPTEDGVDSIIHQSEQSKHKSSIARGGTYQSRNAIARRAREKKRSFLLGLVTGSAGILGLGICGLALRTLLHVGDDAMSSGHPQTIPTTVPNSPQSTAASGTTGSPTIIAQASALPKNNAVTFTIPSSGDPGVLIHLNNDQFVAYDATCTHAGCQVEYVPSDQVLQCPCHGAAFDPAQGASVLQGPAPTPLAPVAIHIDSATGAISLQ
jgi:thiosulfate dehydrogenase (quinone) large subunit